MEAKDVLKLPWINVTDWSELPASDSGIIISYVCENDIDVFVENLFRDIARKLNIHYFDLVSVLKDENNPFYELKAQLFPSSKSFSYPQYDARLNELQSTLRIPDVNNIENVNNVIRCLKLFDELSDTEKAEFLQKIGKTTIKVERFPAGTDDTTVNNI